MQNEIGLLGSKVAKELNFEVSELGLGFTLESDG